MYNILIKITKNRIYIYIYNFNQSIQTLQYIFFVMLFTWKKERGKKKERKKENNGV